MLERAIKRLPVLDSEGKFKGMISRDSLLRAVCLRKAGPLTGASFRTTGNQTLSPCQS